jgi:hypothetical protein
MGEGDKGFNVFLISNGTLPLMKGCVKQYTMWVVLGLVGDGG